MYHTKDLFQLQSELIDKKVELAVSNALNRLVDQINDLKNQVHSDMGILRNEMTTRFSSLETSSAAMQTDLNAIKETQRAIRTKFIDYAFKTGWVIIGTFTAIVFAHLHTLF